MAARGKILRFPGVPPEPPAAAPDDGGDERGFVEVHRCDQAEALVVRSLFESEGIPTVLRSRLAHSVHPFTVGAQGEVVVLVPEGDVDRAVLLLARIAPGPSAP
jgi:hypothetical protein